MKKRTIIILLIIISLIVIIGILTCETNNEYLFSNTNTSDNKLILSLWKGYPAYIISITLLDFESQNKIDNIEFCSGYIVIGDYNISLEKERMKIGVFIDKYRFFSYEEGEMALSNMKSIPNKTLYLYNFDIHESNIDQKIVDKIIYEYKNKKRKTKLYMQYNMLIKDEIITLEINKEFELIIKKHRNNVFTNILWWILLGGRH